jgi:archaeal chaperonin
MLGGQTPILILKEGTTRDKGKGAQHNNIAAAKAIADAVRSTLGPRGMDKMLVDSLGDVVITNDGVTILKEIDVEHPAAKMIVEVAKTQDEEAGDGTTTSVILTGELLKKAEDLIEASVHPTVISAGFKLAAAKAVEVIEKVAEDIDVTDTKVLKNIALTSMRSKVASLNGEALAEIAVKAVTAIAEEKSTGKGWTADLDNIQVIKKQGGSINDTELIQGIILDKEPVHPGMPKTVDNAKIALIDMALEIKKTEVEAKIQITSPDQVQQFLDEEERTLKGMVDKVKASGANVLICQKGIDDLAQHYLAKAGIYAVRRAKKSDQEKLAKATGGRIVSRLDDLGKEDLGTAKRVQLRKIADEEMTFVTGCKNPKAVSILVRGGTEHVVDELERSLHDALSVVVDAVKDGKYVTGGGSTAMEIAFKLREYAPTVGGREQLAIEAFADAIEIVPKTLAENAGIDPVDTLLSLRKAHKDGKKHAGLNVFTGKTDDMLKLNVLEPTRVGVQAITSASDASVMILRIDDVIAAKSPKGGGGGGAGGHGGGDDDGGGDFD